MTILNRTIRSALLAGAALSFAGAAAQAEIQSRKFEVIAGHHTTSFVVENDVPFFRERLPELSEGKITTNTVNYTELGLSGFEIMDLLKLGTNDVSWGVIGYITGDSPVLEGLELPGLTNDLPTFRKALAAYRPLFEQQFLDHYNARLMVLYVQPKLQAFCNLDEAEIENFSLETFEGKKTRVHSTAYADFVESLGGLPVTMSFSDIIPALERGVLDCAITAPSSAYGSGMYQVTNALVDIPGGFSTHFIAINEDVWQSLNDDTRAFLTEQFAWLEQTNADWTVTATAESVACLIEGPCDLGEPGGMAMIPLSAADEEALRPAIQSNVLGRWAERCGAGCAEKWNGLVGGILGFNAGE